MQKFAGRLWNFSRHAGLIKVILLGLGGAAVNFAGAQPTNNSFATPIIISGSSGVTFGDNFSATSQANERTNITTFDSGTNTPVGSSVWYRWVAPTNGSITFDTIGSDFDTVIAAYTGAALTN